MLKSYGLEESFEWDSLVKSLPNYDVYYLSGYVKAFNIHGDGKPMLLWYEYGDIHGACVIMIRDIADDIRFSNINKGEYQDAITPYGYGGFIFNHIPQVTELSILKSELLKFLKKQNIISVFFRFHPILDNSVFSDPLCEVVKLGKTISVDISDKEIIWNNITSKNRNVIRKAEKNGVIIKYGKSSELLIKFKEIYEETMRNDHAEDYYFFKESFYNSIAKDLKDNYIIFYAEYDNKIVSMAIIIFTNYFLHYHLSGSIYEYRHVAPSNLLLYKAALWGCENGLKEFHLGGGIGATEDNLYKFKAAFNRNSNNSFSIGRLIVDDQKYWDLVQYRRQTSEINLNTSFFPLYRS